MRQAPSAATWKRIPWFTILRRSGSFSSAPVRRPRRTPRRLPRLSRLTRPRWDSGGRSSTGRWSGCAWRSSRTAKVLAYDLVNDTRTGSHDRTRAMVWDPVTGAQTPVNVTTDYKVFCSGLAHLMDGSIFVAGGNKNAWLEGIRQTHIFNPATYSRSVGPDMTEERWYASVTPLPNGEMLITGGVDGQQDMPEVRRTDGRLRGSAPLLSTCRRTRGWMWRRTVAPSTRVRTRRCRASTMPAAVRGNASASAIRSTAITGAMRSTMWGRSSSPAAATRPKTPASST
jgi:hypothetical protein